MVCQPHRPFRVPLGKHEGTSPVCMGKIGTGWSRTVSNQIRKQLNTRHQSEVEADQFS
jgi:hypothetical protein